MCSLYNLEKSVTNKGHQPLPGDLGLLEEPPLDPPEEELSLPGDDEELLLPEDESCREGGE